MNCKGKCYLSKKLKQAEEKEQSKDQQSLKLSGPSRTYKDPQAY